MRSVAWSPRRIRARKIAVVDNSEGVELAELLMVPFRVRIGVDDLRMFSFFGFVRLRVKKKR